VLGADPLGAPLKTKFVLTTELEDPGARPLMPLGSDV